MCFSSETGDMAPEWSQTGEPTRKAANSLDPVVINPQDFGHFKVEHKNLSLPTILSDGVYEASYNILRVSILKWNCAS